MSITCTNLGCVSILIITCLSSPINFTWVLYICIKLLSLSRGIAFNFLQTENDITLEDAPESIKQLWMFLLKTSNFKRNYWKKGFPFSSSKHAFTIGIFIRSMGVRFSPWSVLIVGFSIDFNACNRNSFC